MNFSINDIFQMFQGTGTASFENVGFNLLVALIVGQLNAWFYKWTHNGVSYSRTFTQALILITLISALSMMLILTAPLAAFGLLGGLAIIRFRTVVRDARDNVYVLLCLVCGMAAGIGLAQVAIIGSIATNAIAWYLHRTGFGGWRAADSVLRLQIESSGYKSAPLQNLLRHFCRKQSLISVDEGPAIGADGVDVVQCVYKLRLRNPEDGAALVRSLRSSKTVRFVNLLVDPEREEVA